MGQVVFVFEHLEQGDVCPLQERVRDHVVNKECHHFGVHIFEGGIGAAGLAVNLGMLNH